MNEENKEKIIQRMVHYNNIQYPCFGTTKVLIITKEEFTDYLLSLYGQPIVHDTRKNFDCHLKKSGKDLDSFVEHLCDLYDNKNDYEPIHQPNKKEREMIETSKDNFLKTFRCSGKNAPYTSISHKTGGRVTQRYFFEEICQKTYKKIYGKKWQLDVVLPDQTGRTPSNKKYLDIQVGDIITNVFVFGTKTGEERIEGKSKFLKLNYKI